MDFQISKPSFSFTHKKVAKRFAKIQGVKRILSHIKFPAKFFLNMEKGRFSIIQICQIKSVFSSFFLNYLIHKVFFSTAKNKIKIKHRSKILQKISHLSQNKQGMEATQKCLVNSQAENITERNRFNSPKFIGPNRQLIFFLSLGFAPCKAAQPLQRMKHGVTEKGKK